MLGPKFQSQHGFTLIELMIGMLLGLIVTGIAISMYVSTLGITRQTNSTVRLSHELRSALGLFAKDVRRAGYWNGSPVASNPHASVVEEDLPIMVFSVSAPTTSSTSGDCIMLSYDLNRDGASSTREIFGYRLSVTSDIGTIQSLYIASSSSSSGVNCTESGTWNDVTDANFVDVDTLLFATSPAGTVASFASASVRSIDITVAGYVRSDPKLIREYSNEVRVRNDL